MFQMTEKAQKDSERTVQRLFQAAGVMNSSSLSTQKASAQHGEARFIVWLQPLWL